MRLIPTLPQTKPPQTSEATNTGRSFGRGSPGNPVTILLTEGEAQDVAAYLMPGHHPATAGIAEQGAKISEAAARSYGGSWPAHLTYRR